MNKLFLAIAATAASYYFFTCFNETPIAEAPQDLAGYSASTLPKDLTEDADFIPTTSGPIR